MSILPSRFHLLKFALGFVAATAGFVNVSAKPEKWTAPDGKEFSAEASDIIGPFAIFGGAARPARRIPLDMLSDADAIRFANALAKKPARADDWSQSKSMIALDLKGVQKVVDKKLVDFDRKGLKEPLLYIVFYARSSIGDSWGFVGGAGSKYWELKAAHPGEIEFIMAGAGHRNPDQSKMMVDMGVPFLSLGPDEFSLSYAISKAAGEPPFSVLMTRDGSVLGVAKTKEELDKLVAFAVDMVKFTSLQDTRGWKARKKYYTVVQKALNPSRSLPAMLIGDPLDPAKLKQAGVGQFEAKLTIKADGTVAAVEIKDDSRIPDKLKPAVPAALQQGFFVGALKDGVYVDSEYTYSYRGW